LQQSSAWVGSSKCSRLEGNISIKKKKEKEEKKLKWKPQMRMQWGRFSGDPKNA